MPHYLCIDGGGTKTAAVVAFVASPGTPPVIARGEGGPSNLTFGLDVCLAATTEAVRGALDALARLEPRAALAWPVGGGAESTSAGDATEPRDGGASSSDYERGFERIWAAYAGCARAGDQALLSRPLRALFPGTPLRLTGDLELLTAPLYSSPEVRECVTLICGTGSSALLWRRDADDNDTGVRQVGRSGGWGPLLGDEGSGWALGKAAVTSVLTFAANGLPLRAWHVGVLKHFGLGPDGADALITASSSLDAGLAASLADSERKKRIAACARIAITAADDADDEAARIVKRVALQVVDNLEPLVARLAGPATLVVAGGLGQVPVFWDKVENGMREKGWAWSHVVKMPDPGMSGLKVLLDGAL